MKQATVDVPLDLVGEEGYCGFYELEEDDGSARKRETLCLLTTGRKIRLLKGKTVLLSCTYNEKLTQAAMLKRVKRDGELYVILFKKNAIEKYLLLDKEGYELASTPLASHVIDSKDKRSEIVGINALPLSDVLCMFYANGRVEFLDLVSFTPLNKENLLSSNHNEQEGDEEEEEKLTCVKSIGPDSFAFLTNKNVGLIKLNNNRMVERCFMTTLPIKLEGGKTKCFLHSTPSFFSSFSISFLTKEKILSYHVTTEGNVYLNFSLEKTNANELLVIEKEGCLLINEGGCINVVDSFRGKTIRSVSVVSFSFSAFFVTSSSSTLCLIGRKGVSFFAFPLFNASIACAFERDKEEEATVWLGIYVAGENKERRNGGEVKTESDLLMFLKKNRSLNQESALFASLVNVALDNAWEEALKQFIYRLHSLSAFPNFLSVLLQRKRIDLIYKSIKHIAMIPVACLVDLIKQLLLLELESGEREKEDFTVRKVWESGEEKKDLLYVMLIGFILSRGKFIESEFIQAIRTSLSSYEAVALLTICHFYIVDIDVGEDNLLRMLQIAAAISDAKPNIASLSVLEEINQLVNVQILYCEKAQDVVKRGFVEEEKKRAKKNLEGDYWVETFKL